MRLKHILGALLAGVVLLAACAPGAAAQGVGGEPLPQTYFPYPTVPDNLTTLQERTNYLVDHFWEHCNWKSAFSSKAKLQQAFVDYASFMPYAAAENVHASIDALLKQLEKNPAGLLSMAEMAEATFYSDTAALECDECYLPFARAVADCKKLSKADRSRFEWQAGILGSSQVGMDAPDFAFTRPDGTTGRLSDAAAGAYVLLFFNDPDCSDCELARVRLQADVNLNDLIDRGLMKVVSVYPGEPDEAWREAAKTYSGRWTVGASPDIDTVYDMRRSPTIYYLNGQHKILSKTFVIDNLLTAFRQVNQKLTQSLQQPSQPQQ